MNGSGDFTSERLMNKGQINTHKLATAGTDCTKQILLFQDLGRRKVVADFSGGALSNDGGVLLLGQADRHLGLSEGLARCFIDRRDPRWTDHSVKELLRQRLYGLALGYEDLNDHNDLRRDPLLAVACAKRDPLGKDRLHASQEGVALAGASTLNRLELSNARSSRYHKLEHDPARVEALLLKTGVGCIPKAAEEIVLDLDAMGHLLHGQQQGAHFHRYYDSYCYLPLYILVGEVPLWAELRTSDVDPISGVVAALAKVLAALRQRCPKARVIVRADANFCREELLSWCEQQQEVYYAVGFARNSALLERLSLAFVEARTARCLSGAQMVRRFADFSYRTIRSWSRARRVIGKAEVSASGEDARFVVSNLPAQGFADEPRSRFAAQALYEEFYCGRGEMENVLKQQVLDLKADRMSTHYLASNQLRLWLATLAYLLLDRVRAIGCRGTDLARATAGSVRLKLLKVAAAVRLSVRRVHVQMSSAYPLKELFRICQERLMKSAVCSG
jgi:DDE family transposase